MNKFFVIGAMTLLAVFAKSVIAQQMAVLSPTKQYCNSKITLQETERTKLVLEAALSPPSAIPVLQYNLEERGCIEGLTSLKITVNVISVKWGFTPGGRVADIFTGIFGNGRDTLGTIEGVAVVELQFEPGEGLPGFVSKASAKESTLYNSGAKETVDERPALLIGGGWAKPNSKVLGFLLSKAVSEALAGGLKHLAQQ